MTHDPLEQRLRELSWRRKLSPPELAELEAWLAAHPDARGDWETETSLSNALDALPPAPVASNFTARVLQAIERETAQAERRRWARWPVWPWRARWLPKAAFAAVVLCVGLFSYQRVVQTQIAQTAQSVRVVSEVAAAVNPEILENFEAIQALSAPPPDVELLAMFE